MPGARLFEAEQMKKILSVLTYTLCTRKSAEYADLTKIDTYMNDVRARTARLYPHRYLLFACIVVQIRKMPTPGIRRQKCRTDGQFEN